MGNDASEKVPVAEAMKMLYEQAVRNIEFAKLQQWRVSNYALLLYAALVSIPHVTKFTEPSELAYRWVAALLILVIAFYGTWIQWKLQCAQSGERARIAKTWKYFPKEFNDARHAKSGTPAAAVAEDLLYDSPRRHSEVFVLLVGAIWVGAAIAIGVLCLGVRINT